MKIEIVEDIKVDKSKCVKVGEFLYNEENDGLYAICDWWFPVKLAITDGLSKCQVTPMFLQMPFLLKKWINLDILLREIDLLKLALQGKILMHASCVVPPAFTKGTLIVGFPNSGKTYQTYREIAQGATLISEEYTVIDEKGMATPYKREMRTCFSSKTMRDCGMKMTLNEKFWMLGSTIRALLFPFMHEAVIWRTIPASGQTARIKRIVYGSSGKKVTDWRGFAILCENEFPFMANEFLQAYGVIAGLDLIDIQNRQRDLIRKFVTNVKPTNTKQ